ncbi:DNA polymerase beta thumb domain-containing protein [Dioscorea alata]|uniref:DNA polymerase beta thumb domain-containing protein n=1 Tax=Dioscorea alata TaxID=55571 RepID=A0ACB7WDH6_DIOAL|nr:DNA polymerase beta thumb domain-containing protein [Dioscorea alata]
MASTAVMKGSGGAAKPKPDGKGKAVLASPEVRKKVEGSVKLGSDSKQKSVTVVTKSEVKGNSGSRSSKTLTKTTTVKRKTEKKVYTLPGQKHDPPEEREPLRIFYESLSKQIPSSEMAEFWMMEHGLLSPDKAKKAYEKKQRRQQQLRTGTPIKSPPIKSFKSERPESSNKSQVTKNGDAKVKKRVSYSDDDDDFIVKAKKPKI